MAVNAEDMEFLCVYSGKQLWVAGSEVALDIEKGLVIGGGRLEDGVLDGGQVCQRVEVGGDAVRVEAVGHGGALCCE